MESVFPTRIDLFGIGIRDTVISTWAMIVVVLAAAYALRRTMPGLIEQLISFVEGLAQEMIGLDVEPYLPFLTALAVFIAVGNNFGLVPVVVSPTQDLNTPLALALVVFAAVHVFGVQAKGLWGYLKSLASPVFMLPMELIGQFSRTLSLTLRLFGNVVASELIVAVVFMLVPYIVPLPLMGLGMITGILQAYIFTVLAAVYIGSAVKEDTT